MKSTRHNALAPKFSLAFLWVTVALLLGNCSQEPAGSTTSSPPASQSPPQVEAPSQAKPAPVTDRVLRVVTDKSTRHKAEVVQRGGKQVVILNGQPGPEYDLIGAIAFSVDGRSLAYEARRGKQQVVVLGDQEWPLDAEMVQDSFRMSPDHKRLALIACARNKCQVMVDGRPDPPFDFVFPNTLKFSRTSKHTGYLALKGEKLLVVVDGQVRGHLDILTEGNKALTEFLSQADLTGETQNVTER